MMRTKSRTGMCTAVRKKGMMIIMMRMRKKRMSMRMQAMKMMRRRKKITTRGAAAGLVPAADLAVTGEEAMEVPMVPAAALQPWTLRKEEE
jgi:preprotein translocase subunit YajC